MKKLFIAVLLLSMMIKMNGATDLNALGLMYKTDKASNWHNYTEVYSKYFEKLRYEPIKFLEIGLAGGCSARMWEQYFTCAELYFIDNKKEFVETYESTMPGRSQCYLVDQASEASLMEFIQKVGGDFDIILDDGGHIMNQQITSFKMLFPVVKKGGLYVIEDLGTSYLTEWGGYGSKSNPKSGPGTTIAFLQQLIDEINSFTVLPCDLPYFCADYKRYKSEQLRYLQAHIGAIHCYNCLVIIEKR